MAAGAGLAVEAGLAADAGLFGGARRFLVIDGDARVGLPDLVDWGLAGGAVCCRGCSSKR